MPRPKRPVSYVIAAVPKHTHEQVKPQDRQRSARACLPCKTSKIRCDAASPCGPCLRRERTSACVYLESNRRKRQKTTHSSNSSNEGTSTQLASPQFASPLWDSARDLPVQAGDAGTPLEPADAPQAGPTAVAVTGSTTPTPEPGQVTGRLTQSRMLFSSKGEKLYVGETASLSFLQFLRRVLKKYMGPSAFTENQFKDSMLEVEMARDESPLPSDQSRGEKHALVQLYREASSGIIDLFTVDEVHGFLDRHDALSPSNSIDTEDKNARSEQAALNMMLAIGSQCRGQNPLDSFNAARCFTCAQKWAFEGFLCDPSLDLVRVFLLMAFYMLGACHRNAAFMYLGIASKAACALGIHRKEQSGGVTSRESQTRWRTWKSCLILDTIVSSILGRPGGLPSIRPKDDSAHEDNDGIKELDRPTWTASRAIFSICSHIIELEQHLGNGNNIDISTAESFLQRLRLWNDTLPAELRHFASLRDTTLRPADRELFIGATHVACTYYFTIILVTRPFLISHLIARLRHRKMRERRPSLNGPDESHIPDLAQACLDSAVFMAKTGFMAINSQILSNNMCIMKAWMFAAGLLLGFAMFAQTEPVPEVDLAFRNAIAVLEQLAQVSPQARHYYEILTTLSDAINTRRAQLGRERRRKSDRLVSQIFTADFHDGNQMPPPTPANLTPSCGPSNIDPSLTGGMENLPNFDFDASAFNLSAFPQGEDWSDMPLMMSDNLYIDWESIWPVMDGQ